MLSKNKAMVKEPQTLCGYLNFLGRAVVPGRTFTRRMYAKYATVVNTKAQHSDVVLAKKYNPKPYHHIRLDQEFKLDCKVWLKFLTEDSLASVVNRPMVNLNKMVTAKEITFYSDATAAERCYFEQKVDIRTVA